MIKIIYAVPENDEAVDKIVRGKLNKEVSFEVAENIDLEALKKCDFENTIIIARGISCLTLRKYYKHAGTVELALTGYDIMRGVERCKQEFNARKIAVILSENTVIEKEFIDRIMDVNLSVFLVKDHAHLPDVYNDVKKMDIDAILGGVTVCRMAERDNIHCVRIMNGYEANKIAITEAYSIANAIIEERKKNEIFRIILENTNDGVVAVDNMGVITAYNEAVFKILSIPPGTVLKGENISAVMPKLDEVQFRLEDYQESNIIKDINNKMVVINPKSIKVEGKTLGTVLIIQNVDTLQKAEIDIRQKLSKKGLIAKYDFSDIIGKSEVINKTIAIARRYAQARSNVLIIGETGTGKELFAQSIHKSSRRSHQPFVAINCAALPEHLLESELFGYVEGAFTGAAKGGKVGLFELAHKGTLFLDEIAELPLGLQAKLLRVLQEKEIRKLGDDKNIPVDVRIIAASNVDLQQKVQENKFRQDLLYRLDILRLFIPPLRERKDDIKEIAGAILANFTEVNEPTIRITEDAVAELIKYSWPGNVRELRNICERLTVLCTRNQITKQDVRDVFDRNLLNNSLEGANGISRDPVEKEFKKKMTQKEMAEMLGISRTTLWRKMKQNANKA